MFNRKIVIDVLNRTLALDFTKNRRSKSLHTGQDSVISTLIHDIFGGEILKTHERKGWHFYNRINGERVDLTGPNTKESENNKKFEDLPSTPDETSGYFDRTDYSIFFMSFVRTLEEAV